MMSQQKQATPAIPGHKDPNAEAKCMNIVSFAQYEYAGEIIKEEADLRRGIPAIDIVGAIN
jgi:hypothetical protein